jgi:hypothetical protein
MPANFWRVLLRIFFFSFYIRLKQHNMSKVTGKRKRADTGDIHELMSKEDLVEFSVATLKAYCKENGLGATGTSDKLIGNILAHFRGDKENHSPQLDGKLKIKGIIFAIIYLIIKIH